MKEIEPIKDASPKELNQFVNEDVKGQQQVPITVLSEEEEKSLSNEARVHTTDKARVYSK